MDGHVLDDTLPSQYAGGPILEGDRWWTLWPYGNIQLCCSFVFGAPVSFSSFTWWVIETKERRRWAWGTLTADRFGKLWGLQSWSAVNKTRTWRRCRWFNLQHNMIAFWSHCGVWRVHHWPNDEHLPEPPHNGWNSWQKTDGKYKQGMLSRRALGQSSKPEPKHFWDCQRCTVYQTVCPVAIKPW